MKRRGSRAESWRDSGLPRSNRERRPTHYTDVTDVTFLTWLLVFGPKKCVGASDLSIISHRLYNIDLTSSCLTLPERNPATRKLCTIFP